MTVAPVPSPEFERHTAAQWPQSAAGGPTHLQEICHDLRQPLAAILMLASAASGEPGLPPSVLHRLGQITDQAEWLSRALRRSLDNSTDPAGTPEALDLRDLVPQVAEISGVGFTGRLTIHQASGTPLLVYADPVLLHRAIGNLLGNAFRAAGHRGNVVLRLRRHCGAGVLEIEDDGPGFGHLVPGEGIGLAITQRIATACGGYLDIEEGSEGGTLARLWIPTAASGRRGRIP